MGFKDIRAQQWQSLRANPLTAESQPLYLHAECSYQRDLPRRRVWLKPSDQRPVQGLRGLGV